MCGGGVCCVCGVVVSSCDVYVCMMCLFVVVCDVVCLHCVVV